MNVFRSAMATLAAVAMVAVPVMAQAAPSSRTSAVKSATASAPVARKGAKLGAKSNFAPALIALGVALVVAGAVVIVQDDGPPSSP